VSSTVFLRLVAILIHVSVTCSSYGRGKGAVVTDSVVDEPLGSHVLELEIADVVTETDDASPAATRCAAHRSSTTR